MADSQHDWNSEARRIDLHKSKYTYKGVQGLDADSHEDFIQDYRLTHGDVLAFSDYRDTESLIVSYNSRTKQYRFIKNPDVSAAGYLTIPCSILRNVTDFQTKYRSVISNSACINFFISPSDIFVTSKLGNDVPADWEIYVDYGHGGLETVSINHKWEAVDLDSVTLDDLKAFFLAKKGDQARLTVHVELRDEKFEKFKERYTKGDKRFSWITAKPQLPIGWTLETGASGCGSNFYKCDWHLAGPSNNTDLVKTRVNGFLDGFDFSYS